MASGGQIVMQALAEHGAERAFCVAGESYLPVLDAALDHPHIQMITCRQESGATFAAEAYGLLTGKPGIAMVTRGPGACNASIGIHAAKQSSSPVVMLVGLVRVEDRGKEAFQEFDLEQMFGSHTKYVTTIESVERIADVIGHAMQVAVSGRPGPVVVGLPEDVLKAETEKPAAKTFKIAPVKADPHDIKNILNILGGATKPVVIVGGTGWSDHACSELESFASASHLPVVTSFRRQDLFGHTLSNYVGELGTGPNPKLVEAVREADTVLVLNARINEIMTQSYRLFRPEQRLIHVYPSPDEIGKAYPVAYAAVAHVESVAAALAANRVDGRGWAGWTESLRAQYEEWTMIPEGRHCDWQGADMAQVFRMLREFLPKDAVVTTDAGNFSGWCQRYLRYGRPGRLLAPISGAMGYAVPSAVSASLHYPNRTVVGVCGDGGFMMTGMELATALHHGAKPIILLCNNGQYGTIRMHQERDYPGRQSATALSNPDFVKLAESYGAFAGRVEHEDDFERIWNVAIRSNTLSLIEIVMDPRQITTQAKL